MSISRRQFVLGTAAGLILPSYYDKELAYFENHGEPLIEIPKQADTELFVVDEYGSFQFHLGDPWADPVPGSHAQHAVAQDVEGGGTPGIRPPGST